MFLVLKKSCKIGGVSKSNKNWLFTVGLPALHSYK